MYIYIYSMLPSEITRNSPSSPSYPPLTRSEKISSTNGTGTTKRAICVEEPTETPMARSNFLAKWVAKDDQNYGKLPSLRGKGMENLYFLWENYGKPPFLMGKLWKIGKLTEV